MGVIASALRVAEFGLARQEAEKLHQIDPKNPDAIEKWSCIGLRKPIEQFVRKSRSPRRAPRVADDYGMLRRWEQWAIGGA